MESVDCAIKEMEGIESVMAISLCGSKLLPKNCSTIDGLPINLTSTTHRLNVNSSSHGINL